MKRSGGFTLLEVLVALAIFALVAASVLTATARSVHTAARLEEKTLAMWIADNRLTELQLAPNPVAEGMDAGVVQFAGRQWQWQSEVLATREADMRRVTLWVASMPSSRDTSSVQERALLSLDGFVGVRQ